MIFSRNSSLVEIHRVTTLGFLLKGRNYDETICDDARFAAGLYIEGEWVIPDNYTRQRNRWRLMRLAMMIP